MKKNHTQFSPLAMISLSFLAIGLCGHKLSLITNTESRPELALAIALALISNGRTIYACVLGSLILQCALGMFENSDAQTIAATSAWTALTTLVYCKGSLFAVRSFVGARWRDLPQLQDFTKLLMVGGLLMSLLPAASTITAQALLHSHLSAKLLSLEFLRIWLDISISSFVFLPVFLGVLLRNTAAWRERWKGLTGATVVLIGISCYISLTGRALEDVLSRAQLAEQIGLITGLADAHVVASEEAVINFAETTNIQSPELQRYLLPLALRIFNDYPAIRSLSVMIDSEVEKYKFSNPRYLATPIDSDVMAHYANIKTSPTPQLTSKNLPRFSLVRDNESSMFVVYQTNRISDPSSRYPTDSANRGTLVYIEIDLTQFVPTQITTENSNQTWLNTNLKTARSSTTAEEPKKPWLKATSNQQKLATFKLFDQTVTLQAQQAPLGRTDQILRLTLPIKLVKLILCGTYLAAIFVIFTRRSLVRLLIASQTKDLQRQAEGLNIFKQSIEESHEAIAILVGPSDHPSIRYANRTFCMLSGFSEPELIGKDWSILVDYPVNQKELTALREAISQTESIQAELMAFTQTGDWFWVELRITPIYSVNHAVSHWVLIQQNISQRKKNELEMRRIALEAQDVSLAKSRFLANMSHEIRTPLSGIIGLSTLAQQTSDPQDIQKYIKTIQVSAQLQLEIITSILTTLKLEVGQTQLNLKPLQLRSLLNQTADILRPNATLKNISLNSKISNNVPEYIESDSVFLRQILLNLASNAIKFTTQGQVNIFVDYVSQRDQTVRLRFSIEDSGPGLGSLSLTQITKPFAKGSVQNEINNEGLGLGLAIVESFLQLMGSRIEVKRINSLGGATFYFDLDCKYRSLDEPSAPQEIDSLHSEVEDAEWINAFRDLRFLLIEDNLINQIVVLGYLQNSGAQIDTATTGASALSKLSSNRYDLILLDLRIPSFDTGSISAQRKNNPTNSDTPIIGISASQQEDYQTTLQRYGLSDFLPKPIEPHLLFEAIKKCLASKTAIVGPIKNIQNLAVFSEQATGQAEKLKRLFLTQALSLRPQLEHDFFSNERQRLMDSLHLLQGSSTVIAELGLQQAAVEFENSVRTQSSDVEQFLKFIQVLDQSIARTRQQLNLPSDLAASEPSSQAFEHSSQPSRHFNILLVDDNELVCEALGNQILEKALSVDFAHNSEEALLKLDTNRYDVVLSDLVLPDIDGLALSKIITSQARFKGQIIFGLSAQVSDAITQECLNAGMKKLYSKLVDPGALLLALVDAVEALKKGS